MQPAAPSPTSHMTAQSSGQPSPTPQTNGHGFWRRRVRDPIMALLKQGATPDKIALTVAFGIAFGLFPFLGFTSLLCFAVALVFKLNHPLIQIINQLLWPVHLTAIVFYFWMSSRLFHLQLISVAPAEIEHLIFHAPGEFLRKFSMLSLGALVLWLVSVPVLIGCTYYPVRHATRKLAALRSVKKT